MKAKWEVRQIAYKTPGKQSWETIKTFDKPGKADAWLGNYILSNNYIATDFTIRRVER